MIPGPGISPREGNGNPLQCSCLEKSMGRRAWWPVVQSRKESDTAERLTLTFHFSLDRGCHRIAAQWELLICESAFIVTGHNEQQVMFGLRRFPSFHTFLCLLPGHLMTQNMWFPVSLEVPAFLWLPMGTCCF